MDIGFVMVQTAQSGDLADHARLVEALGYESLWMPEHPVIPVNMKTPFPFTADNRMPEHYATWADPFVALSIAAAVTKKIRLGTCICLLPEREPLITAKAVASLDLFSNGRVLFGVGAGWLREETEVMGTNFGTRWKQTRETVEAMRVLWTQREASYEGEMIRFAAVRCEPKPVQKPHPPVILGAHGPKALERVARSYDGWMPLIDDPAELKRDVAEIRKLAARHGRKPESIQILPLVDPKENGPSADDLKRFRDAGANRILLLSQKTAFDTSRGKTPELARHFAQVVERAHGI
jgi:probable F420-dependent oxidoreductase